MINFHQRLLSALRQNFNFNHFRRGQEPVLQFLLNGKSVLAVLPTGSGKTLIYQLFGLMSHQPVLIVSPLLSLMQDQVARMQYLGIRNVVALNSRLTAFQKRLVLKHLNRYRYVYISPEMLSNLWVMNNLRRQQWGLVVIDEVHCVVQWGPDFRPEYLSLKSNLRKLGNPQILMLTATANHQTQNNVLQKLGFADHQIKRVVDSVDRPNIFLAIKEVSSELAKNRVLIRLINHLKLPGVVYFSSRKQANQIAELIRNRCHLRVEAYHSGLDQESRYKIQHQFMNDQLDLICATSAFGMGIDKDNLRFVIHYHLPASVGTYVQEIGRAGRDGQQSIAILLYQPGDENLPFELSIGNLPSNDLIYDFFKNPAKFKKYRHQVSQIAILEYYLTHHFNFRQTVAVFDRCRARREAELQAIIRYANCRSCLRKRLLSYFDEDFDDHNQHCCNLGQQIKLRPLHLYVDHHHQNDSKALSWRPIINRLFNVTN